MNQKGIAVPLLLVTGLLVLIGALYFVSTFSVKSPFEAEPAEPSIVATPIPTVMPTGEPTTPVASPTVTVSPSSKSTAAPLSKASSCNLTKDVCFDSVSAYIPIREGFQEDANYWISEQLSLTGKGSGGYEVSIAGFSSEFNVRTPDQNFVDGTKGKLYIRAQKNVAKKGSHSGTISVKSRITNVTTTIPLTINYLDWNTSNINANPSSIVMNCKVLFHEDYTNDRQLECGTYDSHYIKFYHLKNQETLEIRTNRDANVSKGMSLFTDYSQSTTLAPNKEVYTLRYSTSGIDYNNLNLEPDGTYKGSFSIVEQATQKELLKIPYTLNITAYKQ